MTDKSKKFDSSDSPDGVDAPWRPFACALEKFIAQRVPAAEAKDVLQETFIRLHEAVPSLRDADRAEAWVFSIARRTVADFYRRRERSPLEGAVGTAEEVADEDPRDKGNMAAYEGEHSVHEEILSWLRPMAEELPKPYRRALVMADFEEYRQQEVADELGLSLSGAKSRVQRARVKLSDLLERCCSVEFGPSGQAVAFHRRETEEERDV